MGKKDEYERKRKKEERWNKTSKKGKMYVKWGEGLNKKGAYGENTHVLQDSSVADPVQSWTGSGSDL